MRLRAPLLIAVLSTAGVLLVGPVVANAGTVPTVTPGSACTKTQAQHHAKGHHGSDAYECRETKPGCYLWKFDGHPTGQWSGGPARCPACSPNPSHSHSPSPSPSASDSPAPSTSPTPTASPSDLPLPSETATTAGSPTTSAAGADLPGDSGPGELPVTGPGLTAAISGAVLLLSGAFLLWLTRRRKRLEA